MNEILALIINLIGVIISAIGIIFVFDARKLTEKWFSFGDKNDGTKIFKIVGFIMAIIGAIILMIQN